MMFERDNGRDAATLRPIVIEREPTGAAGSILYASGETRVLCTAMVSDELPRWRAASGKGWLTASYQMLPGSTSRRKAPSSKPDGRATEIQRLIGRSLRAAVDFGALGPRMVHVDCHVLKADGGTRTAAISGGYVALVLALQPLVDSGALPALPLRHSIQAISVGRIGDEALLDLCYREDSSADVDMNVVAADATLLVEVQGAAEGDPFPRAALDRLLDLALSGTEAIAVAQQAALAKEGS